MQRLNTIAKFFIGSVFLMIWAIVNKYPLVTTDTGAYIANIYTDLLPNDRPIMYSLFVTVSSMRLSLWLTVFAQSLWLFILIHQLLKELIPTKRPAYISLFFVLVLSMCTSISWYSSQVMADIFTPIMWISIMLFFLSSNKEKKGIKIFYLLSIIASILMHNSNILVGIGLLLLIALLFNNSSIRRSSKKLVFIILGICLILSSIHYFAGYGFKLAKSSEIFLVGKMSENGILSSILSENCHKFNWKLCDYKDRLPAYAWDYLWSENSPINRENSDWNSFQKEHKEILFRIFTSPSHILAFAYKSIIDCTIQLFSIRVGDGLFQNIEPSNAFYSVQTYFPHELIYYNKSWGLTSSFS